MAKNKESLPDSDLCTNRMRDSNLEDDAEDYIQPSQPLSFQCPSPEYVRKKSETENDKTEISISTIAETLSFPKSIMSTPFGDVSRDFIPESENTVTRKINTSEKEKGCQKRLDLSESSLIKETPDMFLTQSQLNDTMDASYLKVAGTPGELDLENVSLVPESPPKVNETLESEHSYTMFSKSENHGPLGETTLEDSLLQGSKIDISESREGGRVNLTAENTPGEIVTIDSSKFVNYSGMESFLRSEKTPLVAEVKKQIDSQETQLDDTVDAEDIECYEPSSKMKTDDSEGVNGKSIKPVTEAFTSSVERDFESASTSTDAKPELSGLKRVLKNISDEELARLQKHSTPENPLSKTPKINESASSIENGTPPVQDEPMKPSEINFTIYLQMDCQLVMDEQIGEPISKRIINVKELLKRQPKQFFLEPNSDSSYKTKRFSSSSSGSVYSDKTGLPYALSSRSLPMSVNSSSSSVDLAKHIKIVERQVWINEYKIPMAMDEIIPRYIESHKMDLRTNNGKPMEKRKVSIRLRKKNDWSHPLDNVLESSMTEQSSGNNSDNILPILDETSAPKPKESPADVVNNFLNQKLTKSEEVKEDEKEIVSEVENTLEKNIGLSSDQNQSVNGIVSQGLLVFARWTDKRYYPGIVESKAKYDRWEVKFDDETEKVIREELILPLNWLTKGELVFALNADKYMSGKIADIIRDEEIKFKIELDDTNEEIIVKKCDICLNDVMAGIIREKFKPSNKLIPPLKSCDIDVDNVVTGKRIREQRTPIRSVTSVLQPESSTAKKKKVGLNLNESGKSEKEQTPLKKPLPKRELNSEKKTRSSMKRGTKLGFPFQSVQQIVEQVPSTSGETPARVDSKFDVRKKRARTLKYDSDGSEFSIRKLRKSESVTNDEAHGSRTNQKGSKIASTEMEVVSGIFASSQNGEKRKKERAEKQKQKTLKKSSKNEKGKGEKIGDRMSTRPGKSKQFTIVQDITKKKKN